MPGIIDAQLGKKALLSFVNREGPDERAHPRSLIRAFSVVLYHDIHWFCKRATEALISLRICAGWSGPTLSAKLHKGHFYALRINIYKICVKHISDMLWPWKCLIITAADDILIFSSPEQRSRRVIEFPRRRRRRWRRRLQMLKFSLKAFKASLFPTTDLIRLGYDDTYWSNHVRNTIPTHLVMSRWSSRT